MPWKELRIVNERFKFILECERREKSISRICREYGVSRQTGYKWLRRYENDPQPKALENQSRRPFTNRNQIAKNIIEEVVAARKKYPYWGPRKLQRYLRESCPHDDYWPSASAIGRILKRKGLIKERKRRHRTPAYTKPFGAINTPNQVWCIDFKGHFKLGDGTRVYPLTLTDAYSRFLIRCVALLDPRTAEVREILESAFKEFGLPEAIRSDNGAPFASTGAGGLTELSVWWTKLGIRHERIEPGKPQQNGRHERMHLTLKRETATPPAQTLKGQQSRFNTFISYFNNERFHEGIEYKRPAEIHTRSERTYKPILKGRPLELPNEISIVNEKGLAKWQGRQIKIGKALSNELIQFKIKSRNKWSVCFGPVMLGIYNPKVNPSALLKNKLTKKVSAMS